MADSSTYSAVDLTESLILSLNRLRNYDRYTLSLLNLVACDGSYAVGVPFTSSSVIVRHLRTMMKVSPANSAFFTPYFSFLEIFSTGYDILCRYVYRNEKPRDDTEDYRVMDKLLDFLMNIKDAEAGLEHEEKQLSGNDWMARLVVHVLSRLYIGEEYRLDSHYRNRLPRCPCPCKINLKHGSTHIGNPRTYYGCLDVIMGVDGAVAVCETKVNDEDDIDEDEIIAEPSIEEVKVTPLSQNLPQMHSQTIVFSFYQNKCNNYLTFVPTIGICKSHIQFHFYDSTRDIYLMSCEIPLFEDNIPWKLNLSAVVAMWLVVNYKQLMGSCPNEIEKLEKFGFHNLCGEHLQYYKDIKLGPFKTEPVQFQDFLQGTGNYRKLNIGACEAVERKYIDI